MSEHTDIEDFEAPQTVNEGQKSIYELFETDSTMEQQGVVVDFGVFGRFKIARAGSTNIEYTQAFKTRYKPYEKMQRRGTMPEAVAEKILIQIYADSIIRGWEGVYDRTMQPIAFNKTNAVKLMTDLPDLFRQVMAESVNAELYRKEFIEEAAKNS